MSEKEEDPKEEDLACLDCDGSGKCSECKGSGKETCEECGHVDECGECVGSGKCLTCDGTGKETDG